MSTPPPEPRGTVRHPRRLRIEDLERHAAALLGRPGGPATALLAMELSRGDRMRALARRADTYTLLFEVLDRIESALRPDDRYAVVAVDEVWIVLADAPAESIVLLAATALREAVGGHYAGRLDDGAPVRVPVRVSVGGAWRSQPGGTVEELVEAAGRAFSDARRAGNGIVVACADDDRRAVRSRLEQQVRDALADNALEVHYQPQVTLAGRRCSALEALVRFPQVPGVPPVSPALVVSVCEETGLMDEMTRFVINTVLRHVSAWEAAGVAPRVAINLSAGTFEDPGFAMLVAQACETWGVAPDRLVFELTEGSIARDESACIALMHRLRALGCELSIDDFGTGYSSFAYLRRFPVHELKIDRAFVAGLRESEADRRIVRVLVEIAHTFGLRALAEGVEDAETADLLEGLGCDMAQGWHFSPAIGSGDVPGWLTRFGTIRPSLADTIGTV